MNAKQLRDSILQYAMQGKLVPQVETDEPASKLIERIKSKKELLMQQKVIKKEKPLLPITEDEIPFDIPGKWKWVRLRDIGYITSGGTPKTGVIEYWCDATIPWITPSDMGKNKSLYFEKCERMISELGLQKSSAQLIPGGSIVYSSRAPIGHINIVPFQFTTNQGCKSITPLLVSVEYIYYALSFMTPHIQKQASGTTFKEISGTTFGNSLIPLPPFNEQVRIVEKIKSIESKIKYYGEKYEELQLKGQNFPSQLEKSILQYAIQGKLVPQVSTDEPASLLVERIKAGKERLVKEKIIKKEKALPPVAEEEIPFDIPESWEWVRLGVIADYVQRGKSPAYSLSQEIPVVSQKCVQWSGFNIDAARFIDPNTLDKYEEIRFLQNEDLLWNSTGLGTVGRVGIYQAEEVPYEKVVVDTHVTIVRLNTLVNKEFIYYYLASPTIQDAIPEMCTGSTKQKELGLGTIKNVLVPLPPLQEQEEIVRKVKGLLKVKSKLTKTL